MNGGAEEDEDNTTAEILIAQGDDWPTDYYHGFNEPMEVINQILLESESWDLPIHWADVLSGSKEIENLLSCLESIDNSWSAHELFYAIDGCSIQRSPWGSDWPGRSGVWYSVFIEPDKHDRALATVAQVAGALKDYWISSGKAAAAERHNRDLESSKAAEAAIAAEKARLADEVRLRQEVRKRQGAASTLVKKIGAFLNGAREPFRVEGRFLGHRSGHDLCPCREYNGIFHLR